MSVKKYSSFFENVSFKHFNKKILRKDIKVGSRVLTKGFYDDLNLDFKIGTVLAVKEYGCILIEFDESFSPKLHEAEGRGKYNHCYFIVLDNILSLDEKNFNSILEEYKKRSEFEWRTGDIFIGDGTININIHGKNSNLEIDNKIGIVFYNQNRNTYWVGFSKNFNGKILKCDNFGYPRNGAGLSINKINMRELTDEEKIKNSKEIENLIEEIKEYLISYKKNDIVVCNGKYSYLEINNKIGIIVSEYQRGEYIIKFIERFTDNQYDINYLCGKNDGLIVQKKFIRLAEVDEIEKNKLEIRKALEELEEVNRKFEVGDYVICKNDYVYSDFKNKAGKIIEIRNDVYVVEFFDKFSSNLRKIGNSKTDRCYSLMKRQLKLLDPVIVEKLEKGELIPLKMSDKLDLVFCRSPFETESFLTVSYFDITDKNDVISYISIDKMKRLEPGEDPYKSRFRQQMKIGKFFQVLNKNLSQSQVEKAINEFKGNYDLCISGVGERLRLVSGEAVRFWYNGKSYVTGGGSLNSSCMRGSEKGPEMQMFVDNPDVIQLLILTNDDNKLLGRALIWKLETPEGKTYMDHVYTRYENDLKLFTNFAKEHGYITPYNGGRSSNMTCKLTSGKKYTMGVDALDHFDTFMKIKGDTLTT